MEIDFGLHFLTFQKIITISTKYCEHVLNTRFTSKTIYGNYNFMTINVLKLIIPI